MERSPDPTWSAPATADYSATYYRFVTLAAAGTYTLTGASAKADGVMSNAPAAGEQARCVWGAVHKIEAGTGGLAIGDLIYSDANGKGVHNVATAGAFFMGRCVKAATAGNIAEFTWGPGSNAG